ncbi:MAG TPA: MFS transporter [Acidimicrobiales bacterium]|nr:MFS transporter [Acidimicrobiales bacterium]
MRLDVAPTTRKRVVLVICCLSLFMTWLDNAIVNVALPAIGTSLHASVAGLQWTVDAYLVALGSLLLAAGAVSDRIGRRRAFLIGLRLFLAASLACSLAPDLGLLIVFRALQAVGGSLLVPSTLGIITNTFLDPKERAKAIGVWSATFGVALASGPILGGLLVDAFGWRAVFLANIPVGAAAYLLARAHVPESRAEHPRRVDGAGQLLTVVTIAAATFGIIEGPSEGWTSPVTLGVFALAAVCLATFVVVEQRQPEPLLDLHFFSRASFSAAFVIATAIFFVFTGFLFVNTLLLQEVRGDSPLGAGLRTLPATAVIAGMALVGGHLVARRGPRLALVGGSACLLAACLGLAATHRDTGYLVFACCYAVLGFGTGLATPAITNTAVSGMPRAQAGVAAAAISVARQLGNLLGVAVLGSVLTTVFHGALPAALAHRSISLGAFSPALSPSTLAATGHAFDEASRVAWLVAAAVAAFSTAVAGLLITPHRRARAD